MTTAVVTLEEACDRMIAGRVNVDHTNTSRLRAAMYSGHLSSSVLCERGAAPVVRFNDRSIVDSFESVTQSCSAADQHKLCQTTSIGHLMLWYSAVFFFCWSK